jgi:eukaryotic-like serine/threonine-protein kinase
MPATTDDRLLGGRYRLGEPLGRGGMGVVWAGRDEALGREVAVKEVVPPLDLPAEDREKLRRRTLREARAAARISSPAAVTVYDVVEEDGRPWIVMERIAARSLADVLRDDGPLPARRAAEIGLDLLDALAAAAAVGVLHRDVKPANVMFRANGRAVLTDFGIATVEGDATVTTTAMLLGSPAYMSPERARGEPSTLASDLWSLGATLYAAIDGRSPFERQGTLPTLNAVLHDPAPPLAAGGELAEVVHALLAKDPEERPRLRAVRASLQRIVARGVSPLVPAPSLLDGGRPPTTEPVASPPEARDGTEQDGVIDSWLEPPEPRPSTTERPWARRALPRLLAAGVVIAVALVAIGGAVFDWHLPGLDTTQAESGSGDRSELDAAEPSPRPTADAAGNQPRTSPSPSIPGPTVATPQSGASSSPTRSAASTAFALPAGFHLHTDPTGFVVAVPDGWTRSTEGPRTYFREPGGRRFLLVDQTTEPKDDALTDWQAQEPSVAARLSGYERISLDRIDYRGWNAADWEFTWDGRSEPTHVLNRNVRVSDARAYALYWSTPERQWADSRGMFDVIAASFQPASD